MKLTRALDTLATMAIATFFYWLAAFAIIYAIGSCELPTDMMHVCPARARAGTLFLLAALFVYVAIGVLFWLRRRR
jgi:hypothetical protein